MRAGTIIIKNNQILLMHRFWQGREYFVIPGGGIEDGETVEEAAIREAKEETSLDVILGDKFCEFYNEFDKRRNIYFLVTKFSGEIKLGGPEAEKNSEDNKYVLEWHDWSEIQNLNIVPEELKKKLMIGYVK
ncbi:MAG: DNA mismatch repair protein MutT [Candidatus Magasanikbacteria bacterium CG_4_10_14_0_8_um_filter_32_14]|uniref:DNA mismatch repair protein MutT n=2 Tax=Candidatus Magasanikiibacteriota TaxID=1752731 RepID=A0A2M7RAG8_9BACT|nr:MAG: hypothetical protein AUJ23_01425 [Candidatus Magasanikbacteria bacterium CG1_02_32_51]PIY93644.1 MAG: DNA mismatch repair protein MutT [Candidatus Magasanikbacteria bacterium CG_4_10_14_0_8_um_filter_32_14]